MLTDSARFICVSHTNLFKTGPPEFLGGRHCFFISTKHTHLKEVTFSSGESNSGLYTLIYTWGQLLGQVMQYPSLKQFYSRKGAPTARTG